MRYVLATSSGEAVSLLGKEGKNRILAGGTDLLVQMKGQNATPDLVVDIKKIPGMRDILADESGFRIGAAVSGAEMGADATLKAAWPGVVEAVELIGSTQVQGRATMAGNLCNGSPAADSVPALLAAGAVVEIEGPDGTRTAPVAEVLKGPGKTTLGAAELVTSISLPVRPARAAERGRRGGRGRRAAHRRPVRPAGCRGRADPFDRDRALSTDPDGTG